MRQGLFVLSIVAGFVTGCANSGPVPIGQDTYMLTNTGAWSWSSGDALAADLFREADVFCRTQGKQVMPVRVRAVDGGFSNFAQSSVQFRCLAADDPELRRPNLQSTPNVRIENVTRP